MPFFTRLLLPAALCFSLAASAQNTDTTTTGGSDLMDLLNKDQLKTGHDYTIATFKSTRVINGQSVENLGAGVLNFIILHRFGEVNQGAKQFFGLDNANTRIGFDYGITNWLQAGIGRSSFQKEYDGEIKARILRQTDDGHMPISVSYAGTLMVYTADMETSSGTKFFFSNRLSYCNQILIARKFNSWLSLQLTPSIVHYNLVPFSTERNNVLAIGLGGRIKLSHRIALTGEYFYRIPGYDLKDENQYHNELAVGIDIETGGHVFQLHFTNSTGMSERTFIGQTDGRWEKGDIHFGFNISRVFTIVKPKGFEGSRNKIW